jgi:hypothetical protein
MFVSVSQNRTLQFNSSTGILHQTVNNVFIRYSFKYSTSCYLRSYCGSDDTDCALVLVRLVAGMLVVLVLALSVTVVLFVAGTGTVVALQLVLLGLVVAVVIIMLAVLVLLLTVVDIPSIHTI